MAERLSTPTELARVLGASHATAIVVGTVIGSGIFLVPREMIAAVGSSSTVYLVWVVGGLLSLFGAITYAEIAAGRPRYGGEYAFLKDAYGDLPAFLFMWTLSLIGKPASLATIATGLIRVLGNFPCFEFFSRPVIAHLLWGQLVALTIVWLITALNVRGTRGSANVQLSLTWLKVLLIVGIGLVCFFSAEGHGAWHNYQTSFSGAPTGWSGFITALVAALWAYNGWNDISQMAGEIEAPQRNVPIALIAGVGAVAALYMLTNAAIQFVLPANAIAASSRPAADAMRLAAGRFGSTVVSIGMAVSIVASFVGSSLSGARIPFAAAHDEQFFRGLAYVHPRYGTPSNALIFQSLITSAFLLGIGKFQSLFSIAIFSEWFAYAAAASTIFVFRKRAMETSNSFKVPLYPFLPLAFIASAVVILVSSIKDRPVDSLIAVAIILFGVPVHFIYRRVVCMKQDGFYSPGTSSLSNFFVRLLYRIFTLLSGLQ